MDENLIKAISPQKCPHCNKSIMVDIVFAAPTVLGLLSEEDVAKAKDKARDRLESLILDAEERQEAIEYIDDPAFIFGETDIDTVLERFTPKV